MRMNEKNNRLLIVEDDPGLQGQLRWSFDGFEIAVASEREAALAEVRRFEPEREILRSSRGKDLVVLAAHRKSLLGEWVLGTTVQRILRHSRIAVLAIPSPRR